VKRAAWWEAVAAIAAEQLVFLDETGASIRLTRTHARAPRGQRAVGRVPRNQGTPTTLVAALTVRGLVAPQRHVGAMNSERFAAWLRDELVPLLQPGQVVALDNLSAHHAATVRPLVEAAGCTLLYLPPYSPDFSPIEPAFSKVKAVLKKAAARTQPALDAAIDLAVGTITARDAFGFFTHCGYSLAQPLGNSL
jgi:transposase